MQMIEILDAVRLIADQAGEVILDIYDKGFDIETKGDGSPLTQADQNAHALIEQRLTELDSRIPVLSEESQKDVFDRRMNWSRFWMVDPLDGTKEFVKRNGEFTVNIALIDQGRPILGVVHTPVKGITHYAAEGVGAFKQEQDGRIRAINVRTLQEGAVTMVASRSHAGEAVDRFRSKIEASGKRVEVASMGSSLKICLVAEGSADIYPRLAPTSEWDTAAAHCVLIAAGGKMIDLSGHSLCYNKPDILNPWFLACGDPEENWLAFSN